jgi:hypothetical protein
MREPQRCRGTAPWTQISGEHYSRNIQRVYAARWMCGSRQRPRVITASGDLLRAAVAADGVGYGEIATFESNTREPMRLRFAPAPTQSVTRILAGVLLYLSADSDSDSHTSTTTESARQKDQHGDLRNKCTDLFSLLYPLGKHKSYPAQETPPQYLFGRPVAASGAHCGGFVPLLYC